MPTNETPRIDACRPDDPSCAGCTALRASVDSLVQQRDALAAALSNATRPKVCSCGISTVTGYYVDAACPFHGVR